jgi:hypothetical protein
VTQKELRLECIRLSNLTSIEDSKDLLGIFLKFFFKVIKKQPKDEVYSLADKDAIIVFQMIFTKIAHMQQLIEGIAYTDNEGTELNNIIDPTLVASNVRNLYETVAMFNLIYVSTKSEEEKKMLHLMWVHAGLMFRQRFEHAIITEENREKFKKEKQELESIKSEIENLQVFKDLDERNRNKILSKLKEKDYKVTIEEGSVQFKSWQDLTDVIGFKEGIAGTIYTYFSLYSHPSNVAVFQFREMFGKEDRSFIQITNFNMKNFFFLLGIFTADYIKTFPKVLESFERLELIEQIAINVHNTFARGHEYSINNSLQALE